MWCWGREGSGGKVQTASKVSFIFSSTLKIAPSKSLKMRTAV